MDSFPCVICGKHLEREFNEFEAQPSEGVMCRSSGNYGSTVWDPLDGEVIDFNICDPCFIQAGDQGRLFVVKASRPIRTTMEGETVTIGTEQLHGRPHVPWHSGLPADHGDIHIEPEELRTYCAAHPDSVFVDEEIITESENRVLDGNR